MTLMTLEEAHNGDENGPLPEYWALRAKAIAELIEWAIPHLKDGDLHAKAIVEQQITSAEEMGRIHGDFYSGEVSGRYTITGNPLTF